MSVRTILMSAAVCAAFAAGAAVSNEVMTASVGNVVLTCADEGNWTFALDTERLADGRETVTLRMSAPKVQAPPVCELFFTMSGARVRHVWSCMDPYAPVYPNHFAKYKYASQLAQFTPIAVAFDEDERSVVAMATT